LKDLIYEGEIKNWTPACAGVTACSLSPARHSSEGWNPVLHRWGGL